MNNALSALCAIIAVLVVAGAGLYAGYCALIAVFGDGESGQAVLVVIACVLGFFGLMSVLDVVGDQVCEQHAAERVGVRQDRFETPLEDIVHRDRGNGHEQPDRGGDQGRGDGCHDFLRRHAAGLHWPLTRLAIRGTSCPEVGHHRGA